MEFVRYFFRGPLNILRAWIGEKIFRQCKQNFARIVNPLRRNFVTNDGKDSVDSMCVEFLEVPFNDLPIDISPKIWYSIRKGMPKHPTSLFCSAMGEVPPSGGLPAPQVSLILVLRQHLGHGLPQGGTDVA